MKLILRSTLYVVALTVLLDRNLRQFQRIVANTRTYGRQAGTLATPGARVAVLQDEPATGAVRLALEELGKQSVDSRQSTVDSKPRS